MIKKQFTLHDYQLEFQRNISIAVRDHGRTLACGATGSGKTKTFVDTADKAQKKGRTILILSESLKIFSQIQGEIEATHIADGKNYKNIRAGFIYLAMAQTLMRRPHLIEQFHQLGDSLLVIVDEAHVGTGSIILKTLSNAFIVGFTATPEGKHLPEIYRHCVVGPQPHELVVNGYLCGYNHIARERADLAHLRLNSAGDDYSEESQEQVFEDSVVYEGLIEDLRAIKFNKAMIYCASIRDCEHTYETLTNAGFSCVRMHTRMKKVIQQQQMYQFEKRLTPIMINVAMLTKGYDYPWIDLVVLKLKTKKLTKYIQTLGRGSRVLPHEINLPIHQRTKQRFVGLDYGQNWKMHYQWDYEHDWASIWQGKPPKRPGVPPIKYCPQCEFLMPASAKKCGNCGYEFISINIDAPQDQPETVLIEVTSEYTKITDKNISQLTPAELAVYARHKGKRQFAIRIARAKAQAGDVEFLRAYGACMGYKWQWAQNMLDNMPIEKIEFNDFVVR